MCGRYYRTADAQALADVFEAEPTGDKAAYAPAYNIAPTSTQLAIRQARDTAIREIVPMRWGLIGNRTTGPDPKVKTHNARAENLNHSDLWRTPFHKRRCLIPADGFYEWTKKQGEAFRFTLQHPIAFAFAGLWDAWQDRATGAWIQSFAIITTQPNELIAPMKDRMPVILHADDYNRWLDREEVEQPPSELLKPYEIIGMQKWHANQKVGKTTNQGPDVLSPD
jgi:putative SOS response-associated peptidase YedK